MSGSLLETPENEKEDIQRIKVKISIVQTMFYILDNMIRHNIQPIPTKSAFPFLPS